MGDKRKFYNLDKNTVNKIIELNSLQDSQVTSPDMFKKGFVPNENGIMSERIFGITEYDKKSLWGWIDLKGNFLHPLTYRALSAVNRKLIGLVNGTKKFKFDKELGEFIPDEDNGDTGLEYFYKNYNKIKWRESDSVMQQKKLKYLKRDRDKVFINKLFVLPKFYRDIDNSGGSQSYHEINKLYNRVLRLSQDQDDDLFAALFAHNNKARIQSAINEINATFIDGNMQLAKKKGVIRRYVNGKNIDYAARLVITAPDISGERPENLLIPFGYSGLPLSATISAAFPFIMNALKNYFEHEFVTSGKYPYKNSETGEQIYLNFINPLDMYNNDYLKKVLKRYIKSPESRFDKIKLPPNKESIEGYLKIKEIDKDMTPTFDRYMTWTDLLFILSEKHLKDSIIYVTRPPIEHYLNIFPSKIKILTTLETVKTEINGVTYERYPKIPKDLKIKGNEFVDSLVLNNTYLEAIGGDYDGDQCTVRMVFTDEATKEGEAFISSKKNLLKLTGENFRTTGRDFIQTAFGISQPPKRGTKVLELTEAY